VTPKRTSSTTASRVSDELGTSTALSLAYSRSTSRAQRTSTERSLPWSIPDRANLKADTHHWTSSLLPDKYDDTLIDTHIAIRAKILTDVSALLTWSPQNPSPFLSSPTLIYSTGPWTKDNLVTAVEFFFQRNTYHPFAQCSHPQKHSDPVPLTEILQKSAGTATADHQMLHYCPHHVCAGLDPDNSNGKKINNMNFLDKLKIFSYRTIGLWETIRNPIKTFWEFSRYVGRMANSKASGYDKMPANLFKKALEAFRKRAWILINIILAGHYVCSEELLEARVALLKDHGNPSLPANYRPIALCNSFYQLINIIITSGIRGLTEKYTVLEFLQHDLGCNNGIGGFHENLVTFKRSKLPDFS